ncbi:MAG: response regulator [Thermoanaerobaculia bacterium]|nr:response regulator [Thermoanaerobaculia bacterium]
MARLLIVDDDRELVELLTEYLSGEGFAVRSEPDGERGARAALEEAPDLVILDVMLPGLNGFDVLRRLREQRSTVPVVMLSGRGEEVDRVVGLELGADDYLPKPFSPRELAARVRAASSRGLNGLGR